MGREMPDSHDKSESQQNGFGGEYLTLNRTFDVDTIIDVGVAGGTPWLYNQYPTQNLILVEPLNEFPNLSDALRGRRYELYQCAAGSQSGEATIIVDQTRPSLSSLKTRTPLTHRASHQLEKRIVPMRRLDDILDDSAFPLKDLGLKIDTEGAELDVLKGAVRTLTHCKFVVCEVSIAKRFEDSYDYSEMIEFMSKQNFKVSQTLNFGVDRQNVVRLANILFEPIEALIV